MYFTTLTTMSNKFGKIKTADELDKAILSVKVGQKALGTSISKDAQYLLDSVKPSNLVNNFVSGLLPSATSLSDVGIGLVQGIKKIFSAPDKPRSERKARRKAKKEEPGDAAWEAEEITAEVAEEASEAVEETVEETTAAE